MGSDGDMEISHVIFDMDGLLLDTENIYSAATQKLCDRFGKIYSFDIKRQIMGMRGNEASQAIIDKLQLDISLADFMAEIEATLPEMFKVASSMPGAEKLVRHLHAHNIPIAVCTGSNQVNLGLKTTKHKDMFTLFHHVVTCSDDPQVQFGKPHPQPFQVTLSRFDAADTIKPHKVLVFEDSPNGVLSAKAAGMRTVMVPDPRLEQEFRQDADLVLETLLDFTPERIPT
ncbi:pseudouridine-5'-phosphatase-like isoform X2 [Symsagittifera roscoffensis]|uniref:pseudouridine-5'-phosphatase-like isoform X2 n=1 Tax=Symsagittifera roscoffensis TaxID=84072 RepID=UPI00307C7549